MAKLKKETEHKDLFGSIIKVGDVVIISGVNSYQPRLGIGTVKKINPKMINVVMMNHTSIERRYPKELLVVTGDPRVTAYILTNTEGKR